MDNHVAVLSDLLAALMLVVGVYCVGRIFLSFAAHRKTQRDADAVHAVMGFSMAGMLMPSLAAVPTGLWVLVFCASTLWFGWRTVRDSDNAAAGRLIGQHLPHLLMSAAMVYVLIVAEWTGSMSGHGATGLAMGEMNAARWPLMTVLVAALLLGDGALTFGFNMRQLAPDRGRSDLALARVGGGTAAPGDGPENTPARTGADPGTTGAERVLAPRSGLVCQLVMSLVMGYMLLSLL
jgi:hypothetical protein